MSQTIRGFSYENPLKTRFSSAFFASLPEKPGIYLMHGRNGRLLYIGKAKSLKGRLSSYRHARPGSVGENIVELLEHVEEIRWRTCTTEAEAILRESELIHAVRPPYNIARAWPERHFCIGYRIRAGERGGREPVLEFLLTSQPEATEPGFRLFGCYKHRRRTKSAFSALLRLAFAAQLEKPRFSYPARITRASPPYRYQATFPHDCIEPLERFLQGKSPALLRLLLNRMLENERIPAFMYPSLQCDLDLVRDFYRRGPRATLLLKRRHGVKSGLLSAGRMDELIAASLEETPDRMAG